MADRAQSEVLGFVLVFAVVLTAVALVTATGLSGLHGAQDADRRENAERAFAVLADNVAELVTGAPSRGTEMALSEARLSLGDPVTVRVHVARSDGAENHTFDYDVRPVVYADDSRMRLRFVTGAVVRSERHGATLLGAPEWRLGDERTVIPIVRTRARGTQSVGGTASVLVVTRRAATTLLHSSTSPHDVTVEVETPRAAAWERSLEARHGVDCTTAGDAVTCSFTTDRVRLSVVRVDVSFR